MSLYFKQVKFLLIFLISSNPCVLGITEQGLNKICLGRCVQSNYNLASVNYNQHSVELRFAFGIVFAAVYTSGRILCSFGGDPAAGQACAFSLLKAPTVFFSLCSFLAPSLPHGHGARPGQVALNTILAGDLDGDDKGAPMGHGRERLTCDGKK
jgi:hypothetical protein